MQRIFSMSSRCEKFASPETMRGSVQAWKLLLIPGMILSGIVVLLVASRVGAESETLISVGETSIAVGGIGTTTLTVNPLSPDHDRLNAVDITLAYDPMVVTATSVEFLGEWAGIGSLSTIDVENGRLRAVGVRVGGAAPTSPCAAPCAIFRIDWTGLKDGLVFVELAGGAEGDQPDPGRVLAQDGEFVPAGFLRGLITVGNGAATMTPSAAATETATVVTPPDTPEPSATSTATVPFPTATPIPSSDSPSPTEGVPPATPTPDPPAMPSRSIAPMLVADG